VENQNRGASSANLLGLGKSKSTVRFADQLPGRRATSSAVDRRTTAPASDTTPDVAMTIAQTRTRRGSGAIADDDDDDDNDDDIISLPRTKSQLSLMIDQERRKSGTHELRPSPLHQEVYKEGDDKTASKPKDNDDDDDDDDDLLTMGRKDGVTRAGAIDGRAQGKQKMSMKDSDKFRYQSPPTPPLY
jgi:hypothetical protein